MVGAQIDAHSRFGRHWDSALIGWLADAEAASSSGRAVLSTYPPGYEARPIESAIGCCLKGRLIFALQ